MALSTYFPTAVTIQIDIINSELPILICHGSLDPVVAEAMGLQSLATLQEMGFKPEYKSYPMEHAVCPQEIVDIASWIRKLLDPVT
jgi:phospholipase/carboxylesterase